MKRIILSAIAATALCLCGFAQVSSLVYKDTGPADAINYISGRKDVLFENGARYSLKMDFSKAHMASIDKDNTIVKDHGQADKYTKSRGEDYVRDWPVDLADMTAVACKKCSSMLHAEYIPADIAKNVKYRIVVKYAYFDVGHFVAIGKTVKDGGNIAKGIVVVYDAATGKELAKYDMNFLRGKNFGYGERDRMLQFGTAFAKALKKLSK